MTWEEFLTEHEKLGKQFDEELYRVTQEHKQRFAELRKRFYEKETQDGR